MALTRRTQILAKEETNPGTEETSFAAANVLEVLDAEFQSSRPLLDRTPASETLSNPKKAVGASEAGVSFTADLRGGAASQTPDFGGVLQACGVLAGTAITLTLATGGVLVAVEPGDVLLGATSGAIAVVLESAGLTDATIVVAYATNELAFSAAENLTLQRTSTTAAVFTSEAAVSNTTTYVPISNRRLKLTTTANWSSDPAAGEGVTFSTGTAPTTGGGIILKVSTTSTWVEMTWGDVAASDSMLSTSAKTATVHGTPAFDQDMWPTYSIRHIRHNLARTVFGVTGTFGFTADAGSAFQMSFEFGGKKGTQTDAAFVAAATRNTKLPPRLLKSGAVAHVKVDGIKLPVTNIDFSANNESALQRDGNRSEGTWIGTTTSRAPTISITFQQVPTATWDYDADHSAGTTKRIDIRADGGTLNGFTFVAGQAQIMEVTDGDDGGLATTTITFELQRAVADDEFAIRFSTL